VIAICVRQFSAYKIILCAVFMAVCSPTAFAADSTTGVVRNQTRGQFAAGDEVILLRLIQPSLRQPGLDTQSLQPGTQEEARTNTDSQGAFTFEVKHPTQPHLVRVVHQGVNYDQRVSLGEAISVDVFDGVPHLRGITGSIEIIRLGAQGDHLHVSDMIEIKNDSSPPVTEVGERTFETYLPAHAKIDSVLAAGPGKIASLISATPVPGEPRHYTVNFPLQPGATKFAFNYDVPYAGHATFHIKNIYPLQQLAVMIPPAMKFTSRSAAFQILRAGNDRYQVEAANLLTAGEGTEFEISGIGPLPPLRAQLQSSPKPPSFAAQPVPVPSAAVKSQSPTQGTNGLRAPASGVLAQPFQVPWWVLGAGAMMLAACAVLFYRAQGLSRRANTQPVNAAAAPRTGQPGKTNDSMVDALKGELRQLEVDRSLGAITGEEYASARQALEGTVKRALARAEAR
jgi:hypothetical protein